MNIQTHASFLPMLVCVLLISKIGMMLHELEHDPLSEEAHYCVICLSGAPLDSGANDNSYFLIDTKLQYLPETLSVSNIHYRPLYRYLSRAPPLNLLVV